MITNIGFHKCFIFSLILVSFANKIIASTIEVNCRITNPPIKIDDVWARFPINYSLDQWSNYVAIGYYDGNSQMSVYIHNICDLTGRKYNLDSIMSIEDGHRNIQVVFDKNGLLHVAGNMHGESLVYRVINIFEDKMYKMKMTELNEDKVTYPKFFKTFEGELAFTYRNGASGNGEEYINFYKNNKWMKKNDSPLFGRRDINKSMYRTDFIHGDDGYYHVAWNLRNTPRADTNHTVSYAKTKDFFRWTNIKNEVQSDAVLDDIKFIVDDVKINQGLFNNIKLTIDEKSQPVLSYTKYDSNGFSQIYHAVHDKLDWKIFKSTDWKYRLNLSASGMIPYSVSFSGVRFNNGTRYEDIRYPGVGDISVKYNESFDIVDISKPIVGNSSVANEICPVENRLSINHKNNRSKDVGDIYVKWNSGESIRENQKNIKNKCTISELYLWSK